MKIVSSLLNRSGDLTLQESEWLQWGGFLLDRFWAAELGKQPFRWLPHFACNAP